MKELSFSETNQISGGIGFTFLLSILSGATGGDRGKTVLFDAAWWGTVGFVCGLPFYIIGGFILGPVGAVCGATEGLVGHVIGSLFHNP